jgi:hypothetical protein
MAVSATVALPGDSIGSNKLAFDGASVYVTRNNPSTVEAVNVVTNAIIASIAMPAGYWANNGGIVFDGAMIMCSEAGALSSTLRFIDPSSKKLNWGPGINIGGAGFGRRMVAFGPGVVLAVNDLAVGASFATWLVKNGPPAFMAAPIVPTTLAPLKTGSVVVSVAGLAGDIFLTAAQQEAAVIQLSGISAGLITLTWNGAGPGPYVIHNRGNLAAGDLRVRIDAAAVLTTFPKPAINQSILVGKVGNPGSVWQYNFV